MWSVDLELIAGWLASLDTDSREQVVAAIELLEDRGPSWDDLSSTGRRLEALVQEEHSSS